MRCGVLSHLTPIYRLIVIRHNVGTVDVGSPDGVTEMAMRFPKFFSIDDAKAKKAQTAVRGWLNAINYMAPHDSAGVGNLCPHASAGCRALCLGTESGQAAMRKEGEDNSVTRSRKAKAVFFMRERQAFLRELHLHISKAAARAWSEKRRLCVRLNGATDIAWEAASLDGVRIMDHFPEVQFIDYTKSFARMMRFCEGGMPANYHLTFSRAENNEDIALHMLSRGVNVAVVFAGEKPKRWKGYAVIDGDRHDLRQLDPRGKRGVVIALSPKGRKAKRDTSGFVVH